jgi:hypothetical protein
MTLMNSRNGAIAAFIVAFSMLIASASAATYDACPYSTKVDNSWWDANQCEGGIYGYGSLYLKWPDAPFTNETHGVMSVKLIVSGVSQGTDFIILMWNGYSWSALNGGTLDFRGDYVYDLYSLPGPYMDGSMRIKILNRGPETLHISGIRAVVEYQSNVRDLTVTVRDCETNRKIDDVLVSTDGQEAETDDDGVAVLHLTKEKTYEVTIGGDDYRDVKRTVYLYDDDEFEVCVYRFEDHAVLVDDLEVDDNVISFILENTGNIENDDVRYWVYVDGNVIYDGYAILDPGEEEDIVGSYGFAPGRHKVRARAQAGDYVDSETVTHCMEGVTDNYICSSAGNVLREVIKEKCVSEWRIVEYCDEGCADGKCIEDGGVPAEEVHGGVCDIEITSFSYADGIPANKYENLEVGITNAGEGSRYVDVRLYVDGKYREKMTLLVKEGETEDAEFRFKMTEGTHTVKVIATACSGADTAANVVRIKVNAPVLESGGVPEGREPEEAPEIEPPENIYIEIETGELLSRQCEGLAFQVTVHPFSETYRLSITGIEQHWMSYPLVIEPANSDNVYVFISPEEAGNYTLSVKAWLKEYPTVYDEKELPLRITPKGLDADEEAPVLVGAGEGGDEGAEEDEITGMAVFTQSPLLGFMILAALIAVVMILVFTRHYMVETHDYESNWSAPVNYHDEVKKAAIDDFSTFE